ncbi:MAG: ubiquitin-like small modifier protein 1 [Candidatus Bathyarchaeia archaeon]
MKVSVRFFTYLREITNKKEETLTFNASEAVTIRKVLQKLSKRYGKAFDNYVFDEETGEVKSFLQFFINGRNLAANEGLNAKLSDGDVLAIVPPVGGG